MSAHDAGRRAAPPCPICRRPAAAPDAPDGAFPFCSDRCRLVDLGAWFDERYRVAGAPLTEDEAEALLRDEPGSDG